MSDTPFNQGNLVLYKNRPAMIAHASDKLELVLEDGKTIKVRPKDITLLHPGPIQNLHGLTHTNGEVKTAWELLAGETTTLAEVAELAYAEYTPATAWAVWELLVDGLYFYGEPDAVTARPEAEVAQIEADRQAKAEEAERWHAFIERIKQKQIIPEDHDNLRGVEALALGRSSQSRLLRELNRNETPETAHAFLLELGYWDETFNPYPHRLDLPVKSPQVTLPDLTEADAMTQLERVDLTHLPAFAIDDEDSKDPDDAVSLDGDRLWVHIADAAALVWADSPADLVARERGASLYLPEGTMTMLPSEATKVLGLGLNDISPALSFGFRLNDTAEITDLDILPSWVRVQRLSYEAVDAQIEDDPFRQLYYLAETFQQRRQANGSIEIDLPEVKVRVIEDEITIRPILPLKSRTLVREAMLMAGEAVAQFALSEDIPIVFTTQPPPSELEDPPEGLAGMVALRRSMNRRQPKSVPGPHTGLGLETYAQVTSPLRRYLDLVIHQQLRAYLQGEDLFEVQAILERVATAEAVAGNMRRAERLSNAHWTLLYLKHHPEWEGEGVIVEQRGRQSIVLIPELDLETRLYLRQDLPLNSSIHLKIREVNLPLLETHFEAMG